MKEILVTPKNFPKIFGHFKNPLKYTTFFNVYIFRTGNMKEVSRFFQDEENSSLFPEKHRMFRIGKEVSRFFLEEENSSLFPEKHRMLRTGTVIKNDSNGNMHGAIRLPDHKDAPDVRTVFSVGDKIVITPQKIFVRIQPKKSWGYEPSIVVIQV